MVLVVVVSSLKSISKQNYPMNRVSSQIGKSNDSSQKFKVLKFELKAADIGLTGKFAEQFLEIIGNLLNGLQELQKNYKNIKLSYERSSPSPMKSLVNNKFYEISPRTHRKILPRRSTHNKSTYNKSIYNKSTLNKSTMLQHKRPKSVWEIMGLRVNKKYIKKMLLK